MSMIEKLSQLGFSEKEAKVYMAGLGGEPLTVLALAEKATMETPATFVMIESLVKRGLARFLQKENTRYVEMLSPKELKEEQREAMDCIKEKMDLIEQILPEMESLVGLRTPPKCFGVFGDDIRGIAEDLASAGKKTKSVQMLVPVCAERFFSLGFSALLGLIASPKVDIRMKGTRLKTGVIICADRTVFVECNTSPSALVIEHRQTADVMRLMFDTMNSTLTDILEKKKTTTKKKPIKTTTRKP